MEITKGRFDKMDVYLKLKIKIGESGVQIEKWEMQFGE